MSRLRRTGPGYDLVHLFVGSEGTLGVITEACLKIIPLPTVKTRRFLVTFDDWESTGEVIRRLRSSKMLPYLFEFLDRDNIQALNEKLEMSFEEAEATLLVDVEEGEVELATAIFRDCGARKITLAKDDEEAEAFYQARAMAYLAVKSLASGVQVEDVVRSDRQAGRVPEIRQGGRCQARHQDPRQRACGRRQRASDHTLREDGREEQGRRRTSPTRTFAGRR